MQAGDKNGERQVPEPHERAEIDQARISGRCRECGDVEDGKKRAEDDADVSENSLGVLAPDQDDAEQDGPDG